VKSEKLDGSYFEKHPENEVYFEGPLLGRLSVSNQYTPEEMADPANLIQLTGIDFSNRKYF